MRGSSIAVAIAVAVVTLGISPALQAQNDFMSVCRATGSEKSCLCMQGQIPADKMAGAIAAMRKSNASMAEGGSPLDPSSLPPAEMQGLQAVVLAQASCM
jgi:hypothetical protein